MEFEKAYQHLNDQQKEAVDHIDGPLLVIAGPGTGKTQLLSVRVANILKQTDVNPENILCLTFTEVGASNMRHRLTDFIGAEAYKVQIHTYHSFGSYILQDNRPELSAAIDDLDRFTMIREIQNSLEPTDILRHDWLTRHIISAISDLKSAAISPEDMRKIVERNRIDTAKIYATIEDDIQNTYRANYKKGGPIYHRILDAIGSFVDAPSAPEYIVAKVEPIAKVLYRELAEAIIEEESKDKPSTKAMGEWRKKFFKKDKNDRYIFSDEIANKKFLSLANIMEIYQSRLKLEGFFDYDDMILNAIDLLKNDDEARYNAQERFQYILLDEYQDTNDAQLKLVNLLTDNPSNEGKPNIMAVGDDDQAIYGFQGANTSNFFDFDEKYHPKHIFLTQNYRSSEPILQLSENIIDQAEDRFCKAPNVNIDKHITAENPPAETSIELREFPVYQEEYSFVAQKIRQLLDEGVPGNKIAVISPKHKYLGSIIPYLHSLDIQVSYERRENILEYPEIVQLFTACRLTLALAVSDKNADPYWFDVLACDCWGISATEVISIVQMARTARHSIFKELIDSEDERFKAVAEFFADLALKTNVYSAEYIINNISAKLFADSNNYELYSNLNTLRDILLTKSKRGTKKLHLSDFCALVDAYNNAEMQILNKSPYHESDTAVKLETVHSAKGLEFDHVFLIAVDNGNWSEAGGNNDRFTLPRNLEYVRHTGDSADEKIRVFFVAITRARAKLYLTYSLSDFNGKKSDRLKYLSEHENENGQLISQVLPEAFKNVIVSSATTIAPDIIAPNKWFDNFVPTDEVRKNQLKPLVEHYRISPTHLNTFIDLQYGDGPLTFLKHYIIGVPSETSFSMNYGRYVHEIMDEINKEKITNEEAIKRFMAKVDNADATDEEKEELKKRAEAELTRFLDERGNMIRDVNAESERGFFKETITLGDAVLTGMIDRIEIDEENKTITVSDFKTSHPKEKWESSNFGYKLQLYFYKFLLENSKDYQNYKVTKGRIDYVSPSDEDEIISLNLNFKEEEATDIKHLIQVVYRHIKTLDMPDIEDARTHHNPTKAFYDQLISEA